MKDKRLLLAFPHPDDESFGPGGTIAKYAREGVDVHYVCATRGEVGTVDPEMLKPYEHLPEDQRLGALRGQELRSAADILKLTGLHYLGYRDSGMAGTEANRDPRAFINADPERVTGQLVKIIRSVSAAGRRHVRSLRRLRPSRSYLHPSVRDESLSRGRRCGRYPEAGPPYRPQKLYWTVFPKGLLKFFVLVMRLTGRDPTKFGRNGDIDLKAIAAHDYPPTTRIDVWPYYAIKQQAPCHTSQLAGGPARFGVLHKWFMMTNISPGGTRSRRATS